jgi:hypothetical protein
MSCAKMKVATAKGWQLPTPHSRWAQSQGLFLSPSSSKPASSNQDHPLALHKEQQKPDAKFVKFGQGGTIEGGTIA